MKVFDQDIAHLCLAIYANPGGPIVEWDHVFDGGDWGIYAALKHYDDMTWVIFRGSRSIPDWIRDLLAATDPHGEHYGLGPVHPLMFQGMPKFMDQVYPLARDRLGFGGHSLGADRAIYGAGLALLDGRKPVVGHVAFAPAKPGFARLKGIVNQKPGRTYRNGHPEKHEHDFVTTVPFTLGVEEYQHVDEPTDVYQVPEFDNPLNLFRFHHMSLYAAAPVEAFTE